MIKTNESFSARYRSKNNPEEEYLALYIGREVQILYRGAYEDKIFTTLAHFESWLEKMIPVNEQEHKELMKALGLILLIE